MRNRCFYTIILSGLVLPLIFGCRSTPSPRPASAREDLLSVELSDELSIRGIAPDVLVVEHRFPWAANSLLVKVSDGRYVFVDTPYTRLATQEVMEWLTRTFGAVEVIEINTGYHADNLGGNEYLLKSGVPVYGSFLTDKLLRDKGEETRRKVLTWLMAPEHASFREAHEAMSFYPPNELFQIAEGLAFDFPDETVEAYYPGPSHAEDNLVVYFSRHKVLFGGGMVKSADARDLGFTADADLQRWPGAIERVRDRFEDAEIVVPGHGEPGDQDLLEHTLSLLEARTSK